jgi:O-succinylbenzoate synthase
VTPTVKVERAEIFLVPLRLREPFATSTGVAHDRGVMLVALHAGGAVGWAECSAGVVPGYTPETADDAWTVLADILLPIVVGRSAAANFLSLPDRPMARAAVEMALRDLDAKLRGVPLYEALGGARRPVPAGIAFGLEADPTVLEARIAEALEQGYRRIKLKIEPGRDVEVLRAVRSRFPDAPLSVDANGAYTLDDLPHLRELDAFGLLMLEQPLPAADLEGHARLQARMATSICLDESIGSLDDAARALELGSGRVVNLKPARVGGLGPALAIHSLCAGRGVPLWCGGMLESGVGRAHIAALATLPGFTLPGDLSPSRRWWERDLVSPEWEMTDGALLPPDAPGIGVAVDRDRIEALATRRTAIA